MIKYYKIVLTKKNNKSYIINSNLRKYTQFRISSIYIEKYSNYEDPHFNYFIIQYDGGFMTEIIKPKIVKICA